jgi:hypothetical protein
MCKHANAYEGNGIVTNHFAIATKLVSQILYPPPENHYFPIRMLQLVVVNTNVYNHPVIKQGTNQSLISTVRRRGHTFLMLLSVQSKLRESSDKQALRQLEGVTTPTQDKFIQFPSIT